MTDSLLVFIDYIIVIIIIIIIALGIIDAEG